MRLHYGRNWHVPSNRRDSGTDSEMPYNRLKNMSTELRNLKFAMVTVTKPSTVCIQIRFPPPPKKREDALYPSCQNAHVGPPALDDDFLTIALRTASQVTLTT